MAIHVTPPGMILRQSVAVGKIFAGKRTTSAAGRAAPVAMSGRSFVYEYDLLEGATAADTVTGFDFVDGGAGSDTIVRNDGGSWLVEGYAVGSDVTVASANTGANDGAWPLLGVSEDTLTVATGSLTADAADTSAVFSHEGGEGLFEFDPFVAPGIGSKPMIFVSWVKLRLGSSVSYDITMTDGDLTGGSTDIDDPVLDVPLATGSGSDSVRIMRDFPPGSKLRVITGATTGAKGIIEVEFHTVVGDSWRPLG